MADQALERLQLLTPGERAALDGNLARGDRDGPEAA